MPYVGRLRFLALLVTLYQASRLQWLVHRFKLLPPGLRAGESLLPKRPFRPRSRPSGAPPSGAWRGRVGLFIGCIQEAFLGDVNQAAIRVLERNGYEVVIPPQQTCCGALQFHQGERALTIDLAKKNIDAFLEADVDAVVVSAGGCGPMLKAYPELLTDDPNYTDRAQAFRARLRDVCEFLVESRIEPPRSPLSVRATYSDSCHLRNQQGVIYQPRELVRSIPGLEYVELQHPDRCCGSAGIYNILQPDIATQLLDEKLADIAATAAQVVVVTNPGCHLQISAGIQRAGLDVRVVHLVQLLDEAYATERGEFYVNPFAVPGALGPL
jgi:glycolate oxidase iron-sulfur subunit